MQELVTFQDFDTPLTNDPRVHLKIYSHLGTAQNIDVLIDQVGNPGAMMPTIADIDRDGHNEVVVAGDYWTGSSGDYFKIWVFDFGGPTHGSIEWGQAYGNDDNTGSHRSASEP
jgi:hypothetical protein